MADKGDKAKRGKPGETRQDRLKAALKANLKRRKTQAQARTRDKKSNEAG